VYLSSMMRRRGCGRLIVVAYLLGWALTSAGRSFRRGDCAVVGLRASSGAVSFLARRTLAVPAFGVVEYGAVVAASKVVHDDEPVSAFISEWIVDAAVDPAVHGCWGT